MDLRFTCKYCDEKWEDKLYNELSIRHQKCKVCNSSDLKVVKREEEIIDTYAGSPPFPEKTEDVKMDTPPTFAPWEHEGYD